MVGGPGEMDWVLASLVNPGDVVVANSRLIQRQRCHSCIRAYMNAVTGPRRIVVGMSKIAIRNQPFFVPLYCILVA